MLASLLRLAKASLPFNNNKTVPNSAVDYPAINYGQLCRIGGSQKWNSFPHPLACAFKRIYLCNEIAIGGPRPFPLYVL
jgi:hypothetical protein